MEFRIEAIYMKQYVFIERQQISNIDIKSAIINNQFI